MTTWTLTRTTGSDRHGDPGLEQPVHEFSSRESGARLRTQVLAALGRNDQVVIDFSGIEVTPSFADEAIGILAAEVGFENFKTMVRLLNVPDGSKVLLRHVVRKRVSGSRPQHH